MNPQTDSVFIKDALDAGKRALAEGRARIARIAETIEAGRALLVRQQAFRAPEAGAARESALAALENAREAKNFTLTAVVAAETALAREEDADAIAASLAILVEHGQYLGVHDEHCPLCAAPRTSAEFALGLEAARRRISSLASGVQGARRALAAANDEARKALSAFTTIERDVTAHQAEEQSLLKAEQSLAAFFERFKIDPRFLGYPDGLKPMSK